MVAHDDREGKEAGQRRGRTSSRVNTMAASAEAMAIVTVRETATEMAVARAVVEVMAKRQELIQASGRSAFHHIFCGPLRKQWAYDFADGDSGQRAKGCGFQPVSNPIFPALPSRVLEGLASSGARRVRGSSAGTTSSRAGPPGTGPSRRTRTARRRPRRSRRGGNSKHPAATTGSACTGLS